MQILAIERELPAGIYAHSAELIRAEAAALWKLQKDGPLRHLWCTADQRTVLLLECGSAVDVRRHLATLPMVERGQIEFSVLELRNYDGFEELFHRGNLPAKTATTPPAEPPEY